MIYALYTALIFYSALDAYQTKFLFDFGCVEINPFLSYLIEITGTWQVIIWAKALFLAVLCFLDAKGSR